MIAPLFDAIYWGATSLGLVTRGMPLETQIMPHYVEIDWKDVVPTAIEGVEPQIRDGLIGGKQRGPLPMRFDDSAGALAGTQIKAPPEALPRRGSLFLEVRAAARAAKSDFSPLPRICK